jgi:hypothetical protein
MVVASGGKWIDPSTGEVHDKLHLHWRLAKPASGETLAKLKQARDLAARLVGGDPSNKPVCHPIRWPGSWHRKSSPVLCSIDTAWPDQEIDLATALAALTAASPARPQKVASGEDRPVGAGADWTETIAGIVTGSDYHNAHVVLAAKLINSGMRGGAAVEMLRGLMNASASPRDDRWKARYDDIWRSVRTAEEKFAKPDSGDVGQTTNVPLRQTSGGKTPATGFDWRKNATSAKGTRMMEFNPITFLVPNLIPNEGICLVCAKPKVGKSWLVLDIAVAATMGRYILGDLRPVQGDVLYLALEDSLRRLQSRMTRLLPSFTGEWPEGLTWATQWRRVDQGGLDDIREWANETKAKGRSISFIAIDVLKMVRPPSKGHQPPYEADYEAIKGLHSLSIELGIPIIIVHHTRKADAEDLIDKVSGTAGLTGAADTIIVIEHQNQGTVFDVRGRDVEANSLAVEFNKETCRWTILGNAAEVLRSETRTKIIKGLASASAPLTPKEIAAATGLGTSNVSMTLARMLEEGEVSKVGTGKWALPTITQSHPATGL